MLQRGEALGEAGAKLGLLAPTAIQELVTLRGDPQGPWLPGVPVCHPFPGCRSCPLSPPTPPQPWQHGHQEPCKQISFPH